MTGEAWIKRQTQTPEARKRYEEERLILHATEAIARSMDESGLSRTTLAEALQVSKPHITQLLSGARNMTLRTLADLAFACGMRACVRLEPLRQGEFISEPVKLVRSPRPRIVQTEKSEESKTATAPIREGFAA